MLWLLGRSRHTVTTSEEVAPPGSPCWYVNPVPSESSPGIQPGHGVKVTVSPVGTRISECCHHPSPGELASLTLPSTPVLLQWVTRLLQMDTQCPSGPEASRYTAPEFLGAWLFLSTCSGLFEGIRRKVTLLFYKYMKFQYVCVCWFEEEIKKVGNYILGKVNVDVFEPFHLLNFFLISPICQVSQSLRLTGRFVKAWTLLNLAVMSQKSSNLAWGNLNKYLPGGKKKKRRKERQINPKACT